MIMETISDLQLVRRAQAGDQESFAALVDRHYMTVYRFAFKWCRSREDAEDITQEALIKLGSKIHLFDRRAKFTSWLYRITINCAKDYARSNKRWTDRKVTETDNNEIAASANPGPEETVIARGVYHAIGALPDALKEVMLLVYGEGMNHGEAAMILGCAETTVSWRIFKAKRKLRKVLS